MKERVTMRLDERVESWARREAAKRGLSLFRFVEQLLESELKHEAATKEPKQKPIR